MQQDERSDPHGGQYSTLYNTAYRCKDTMKKVLVIDDNPTIVELIKYAVNLQGAYQVVVAYDGVQGLESVYAEHPDCVIIDVKMPRMDGYQLVRCLRGDVRTANTPMIILSAMTREEDQMTGMLSGVDEYLTKPFKPSALNAAIERVLRLTPIDRQRRMDYLVQTQADRE
jgi:DNA-binding response OmpR family regulator